MQSQGKSDKGVDGEEEEAKGGLDMGNFGVQGLKAKVVGQSSQGGKKRTVKEMTKEESDSDGDDDEMP